MGKDGFGLSPKNSSGEMEVPIQDEESVCSG